MSIELHTTLTPKVSYETFGVPKGLGPSILVIHALTGNSTVAGENGWWKELFGEDKLFDTRKYHIVGINIPGNGYRESLITNYKDFCAHQIARVIVASLKQDGYSEFSIGIGGSLGGGILWDILINDPDFVSTGIPIACNWHSNDWIKGFCHTQDLLLNQPYNSMALARQMAMFFYRNPSDFALKFNNEINPVSLEPNVIGWLNHHGRRLEERFNIAAYRMMNHLLGSIDATKNFSSTEDAFTQLKAKIIQVVITSDILFCKKENLKTKKILDQLNKANDYVEIESPHGHDAFLIEYESITKSLSHLINTDN
jgi:homoserine O-acetyltransferase